MQLNLAEEMIQEIHEDSEFYNVSAYNLFFHAAET